MAFPSPSSRTRAFSLTEMIVAMAILAVLVIFGLQSLQKVRDQQQAMVCLTRLRNIGAAMQLYVNDHDGMLPGPYSGGQRLGYSLSQYSDRYHLPRTIGPYLGLPAAVTGPRLLAHAMVCPAWLSRLPRTSDPLDTPCFINLSKTVKGEVIRPFGKSPDLLPMRLAAIEEPASFAALTDIDILLAPSYVGKLPDRPVHGAFRNTLFLDWHVSAVPIP